MSVTGDDVTGLITKLRTTPDLEIGPFTEWLVKLMISGAKFPGFWSAEILPPQHSGLPEWKLIQHFRTPEQAHTWRQSESRRTTIGELASLPRGEAVAISDELSRERSSGSVATAIVTDVKPGMESAYWTWEEKVQSAQAKYPGYGGVYLLPPVPGRKAQWTTLLRFDSPATLENWFVSEERKRLLTEANQFIRATHFQNLKSSFPGWFPSDQETGQQTPKWKTAILVLLALYPTVMMLRRFFFPLLSGLNLAFAYAINSIISVSLVSWVAMPILIRTFKRWLLPMEKDSYTTETVGSAAAICFFAAEIVLLWNLFPAATAGPR
jgi:hypothetical protein